MIGILGKKLGMSRIFQENKVVPCTVMDVEGCYVIQKKTKAKDGYDALQLGIGEKKKVNKTLKSHFEKAKVPPRAKLIEIRDMKAESFEPGQKLNVDMFKEGDVVSVTGYTKGRGFTGGVKRWNWRGSPASHGGKEPRRIGSVGATTDPGRLWKGKTLHGHYGNEKLTIKNLKVVKVDKERNLLFVKGAVPGPKGGILVIRKKT